MNSLEATGRWDGSTINYNVPNLSHEDIGRGPARRAIRIAVRASVDESQGLQGGRSFQDRPVVGITDELGHVVENNGVRDQVGAGRDVYNSRCVGRRLTDPRSTTIAIRNSPINSSAVVSDAVA